jgi:hypothetical protein
MLTFLKGVEHLHQLLFDYLFFGIMRQERYLEAIISFAHVALAESVRSCVSSESSEIYVFVEVVASLSLPIYGSHHWLCLVCLLQQAISIARLQGGRSEDGGSLRLSQMLVAVAR